MTVKEAVLKSLQELKTLSTHVDVCNHILKYDYYNFGEAKTPAQTISATLGNFIRSGDSRVKRVKSKKGKYSYYLASLESDLNFENTQGIDSKKKKT